MKVTICMGSRCTMMGASSLLDAMEAIKDGEYGDGYNTDELTIDVRRCLNYCKEKDGADITPVVLIDGEPFFKVKGNELSERVLNALKK